MFKINSLIEINKIAGTYKDSFILLKNSTLLCGISIGGMNYFSSKPDVENAKLNQRVNFLKKLENLEANFFCIKRKVSIPKNSNNKIGNNPFVKEIISKIESKEDFYQLNYYLFLTTSKNKISILERKKIKETQEVDINNNIELQEQVLNNTISSISEILKEYNIRLLNTDEILSFNANYCNMQETPFIKHKYTSEDYFTINNIEFKKNYIIHELNKIDENNNNKRIYSRIISIKNYEASVIFSSFVTELNKINCEFYICSYLKKLSNNKAIKEIQSKTLLKTTQQSIDNQELIDQIKNDEETLFEFSYSIIIKNNNLDRLNAYTNDIIGICERNDITAVIESINLKSIYCSYMFGNNVYNVRRRLQTSSLIATIINLENDNQGFTNCSWGKEPLAVLKHQSGLPYMFCLQKNSEKDSLSHSLIIGDAGSGKTMLMQIIMLLAHRYDIKIIALDKLNGMFVSTKYLDGSYNDMTNFELNPLSLISEGDIEEKKAEIDFLKVFFKTAMNIDKQDSEAINDLNSAIDRYARAKGQDTFTGIKELSSMLNENNKQRLQPLENSILDNMKCSLNFDNKFSVFNMDSIIKDKDKAGLVANYIFKKLSIYAQKQGKGFLVWIDELKDYLHNQDIANHILESILESRKLNGSVAIGVQNIDFFDNISNKDSFLSNITNFFIFPTSDTSSISKMQALLELTSTEVDFLSKTPTEARKFLLIKKRDTSIIGNSRESNIIDFNQKRNLKEYINVFSSSSSVVLEANNAIKDYGAKWRTEFLKAMNRNNNE